MRKLARHHVDRLHALGSVDNALIVVWQGVPTDAALEGVRREAMRLLEEFPCGIGVLGVSGGLPLSGADDRQRLGPLLRQHGERVLGLASVIEGSDPTRNVMTSINLVLKHPCPLRIFASVDEGVAWLAPLLGRSPIELRHAVEGLRRELLVQESHLN